MTLKVVDPISVTDSVLIQSSIPEPDPSRGEVEWSSNLNSARYSIESNSTAIATSGTVDYVVSFDGSAKITEYTSGVQTYTQALSEVEFLPSDAHYYDGFVYIADLTTIKYYNVSSKVEGEVVISGGVETGTVFTSITSVDDLFYLYDRANKKVKKYTLVGNTLTHNGDINKDIGGEYPKLTTANSGGFFVLADGVATTYSDVFNLISSKKVPLLTYQSSVYGGISNTGSSILAIGASASVAEVYDYNFDFTGFYNVGDRVVISSEHKSYQCLIRTDQDPRLGAKEDATATWIVTGPTNKWAMFDGIKNTKSKSDSQITFTLNPVLYMNTLALLGFSGVTSVRVEVDNSSGDTIYDKTLLTSDFSAIYDHYTYVFYQVATKERVIFGDLPPLPNVEIRVTVDGSNLSIGEVVGGFAINIGDLVTNSTKSDRFRYREQEYNDFGYPVGAPPIVVELNTYDVLVPKLNNPAIQKLLDGITGKNTLWVGDIGGGQELITYGFFERSPIPFTMPNDINYQITVRASV